MFALLVSLAVSRELRTLHVGDGMDGDCFNKSCDFATASMIVRNGDTIIFDEGKTHITSNPSPISDLFHAAMFMNVTLIAPNANTVIDGQFMGGDNLFEIFSASRFCWLKFIGFTFTNFEKSVFIRVISETPWPLFIFKDCTFTNNKADVFNLKGGTFQFENCEFSDNEHRPIKAITEATVELTDCLIERSEASFFFDTDLIINNCRFFDNFGGRGGALYLSKVTLNINGAKFVRNSAKVNGGAIYIRESPEDFDCEIKKSVFIDNEAAVNGSAIYTYWSDVKLLNNCYDKKDSIFQFKSNNTIDGSEYSNKCTNLINYEPKIVDFDPYKPEIENDIDVEVEPNSWIEL